MQRVVIILKLSDKSNADESFKDQQSDKGTTFHAKLSENGEFPASHVWTYISTGKQAEIDTLRKQYQNSMMYVYELDDKNWKTDALKQSGLREITILPGEK